MLLAAACFVISLFLAMQFHSLWFSCALFAAAVVLSAVSKKIFPAAVIAAGLLIGHYYHVTAPIQPFLRDKGFAAADFGITGFPVLTPDGKYAVKSGDVTILSEEAFTLYRTQTVSVAGPVVSFSTNGRKFYRVFAREIRVTGHGFRPFGIVSSIRKWVDDRIRTENDPDVRSLLYTMILGNTQFLDYSVKQSFRMTGVTHLLAISGLNVAVIGLGIYFLLKKILGKKAALGASCAVVVFYVVTAGLGASVLRAGIMFVLYQSLRLYGKDPDILDVAAASLFPVLVFDPSLLFDMGFWLSYGALAGILLAGDGLRKFFRPAGKLLSEALGTTLAANFTTLPLTTLFFGGFSLISPLANLFIIPVFNVITYLLFADFLVLLTGWSLPLPLSEIPLRLLWSFSVRAADLLSLAPSAYVSIPAAPAVLFVTAYAASAVVLAVFPALSFGSRIKKLEKIRSEQAENFPDPAGTLGHFR